MTFDSAPNRDVPAPPPGDARTLRGARVLVVDDEAVVRALLRRLLEDAGAHVTEAHDGEEGLRAAESADGLDLVLTDLRMPKLDGRGLFDALGRSRPELPVIGISAHGDPGAADDPAARPMTVLPKPIDWEQLLDVVHATVRQSHELHARAAKAVQRADALDPRRKGAAPSDGATGAGQ